MNPHQHTQQRGSPGQRHFLYRNYSHPYWRRRHPCQAAEESLAQRRVATGATGSADISNRSST
ncbi:hypothetical protein OG866_42920 [Streptomyces sp. NBC_00663]|uniref:hypothetical protein n=1 Tax=Streptomyces sp. NBC_00663 TaxID=2975801 RepID=UPI002E34CAF6|nr:hypothetical protein [Streptomyces sp. NBC_00663]